jgi:hypothetical protein
MSYNIVFAQGTVTVAVPAGEKIAVQAYSPASVFQEVGFPNFPEANDLLSVVENTTYVSSAFTNATNVIIQAGASGAAYAVGTAPVISDSGKYPIARRTWRVECYRHADCCHDPFGYRDINNRCGGNSNLGYWCDCGRSERVCHWRFV